MLAVTGINLQDIVRGFYFYDAWQEKLPHVERNAMAFIRAYQNMRSRDYRGGNAQAYHNWRNAWLLECSTHLPPYSKWRAHDGQTQRTEGARRKVGAGA